MESDTPAVSPVLPFTRTVTTACCLADVASATPVAIDACKVVSPSPHTYTLTPSCLSDGLTDTLRNPVVQHPWTTFWPQPSPAPVHRSPFPQHTTINTLSADDGLAVPSQWPHSKDLKGTPNPWSAFTSGIGTGASDASESSGPPLPQRQSSHAIPFAALPVALRFYSHSCSGGLGLAPSADGASLGLVLTPPDSSTATAAHVASPASASGCMVQLPQPFQGLVRSPTTGSGGGAASAAAAAANRRHQRHSSMDVFSPSTAIPTATTEDAPNLECPSLAGLHEDGGRVDEECSTAVHLETRDGVQPASLQRQPHQQPWDLDLEMFEQQQGQGQEELVMDIEGEGHGVGDDVEGMVPSRRRKDSSNLHIRESRSRGGGGRSTHDLALLEPKKARRIMANRLVRQTGGRVQY